MNINEHMIATMREATGALRDGRGNGAPAATEAIQRTLREFLPNVAWPVNSPGRSVVTHEIDPVLQTTSGNAGLANSFVTELLDGLHVRLNPNAPSQEISVLHPHRVPDTGTDAPARGRFIDGSYTNPFGTRTYKLYIPASYQGQSLPLLVMLHGCTQNPDDFAAGTGMNAIAEEQECFVAYPSQEQSANHSRCWNWFKALDQQREQGEPSIIAGMTRDIIKTYHVDERQVFIAGMSSGGAMAVIMATTYPDLYAAVGVHSGLPYAAAQDLPSALAAMQSGASATTAAPHIEGIPIIVFHGDKDRTVHPRNGEQIIARSLPRPAAQSSTEQGKEPNGRAYQRTIHRDANGQPVGEHWVVHGTGHAWSGGSHRGTYTDPQGPDASRAMMRFFLDSEVRVPGDHGVDHDLVSAYTR
ncbi:MAG: PHB depolymerase family esterase [Chloroflexota bacterium]